MANADSGRGAKPNILVIWGDDIGITNLSCYSDGLMGYRTPNIDRIANEGMRFTDSYGEQSCTAGRASFITGQSGYRTGLTKVGIPGATVGLQAKDPTIAELLKPHGYATGQFGKNHLGDRNEYLPTVHGFDEFFGNLYHLNAEEEPELPDYPDPKEFPEFRNKYGPRGVLHCWATEEDDDTEDPRFGRVGKQKIEDTGPLTKKRMETIDDEIVAAAKDWIKRQSETDEPWFCWVNTTHMHLRTHPKLTGKEEKSPRPGFIYFDDDGNLVALRYDNWKVVFMEQRAQGTLRIWAEPFTALRLPKLFNLRTDPFERADITSNTYYDWLLDHVYIVFAAQGIVTEFIETFKEFPPAQKAASFTIDQALENMTKLASGAD